MKYIKKVIIILYCYGLISKKLTQAIYDKLNLTGR